MKIETRKELLKRIKKYLELTSTFPIDSIEEVTKNYDMEDLRKIKKDLQLATDYLGKVTALCAKNESGLDLTFITDLFPEIHRMSD